MKPEKHYWIAVDKDGYTERGMTREDFKDLLAVVFTAVVLSITFSICVAIILLTIRAVIS